MLEKSDANLLIRIDFQRGKNMNKVEIKGCHSKIICQRTSLNLQGVISRMPIILWYQYE